MVSEISSDVESFCNLYPSVPVLVTSREVGYEQAPLDEKKFEIFRLAPLKEDQVEKYVTPSRLLCTGRAFSRGEFERILQA